MVLARHITITIDISGSNRVVDTIHMTFVNSLKIENKISVGHTLDAPDEELLTSLNAMAPQSKLKKSWIVTIYNLGNAIADCSCRDVQNPSDTRKKRSASSIADKTEHCRNHVGIRMTRWFMISNQRLTFCCKQLEGSFNGSSNYEEVSDKIVWQMFADATPLFIWKKVREQWFYE